MGACCMGACTDPTTSCTYLQLLLQDIDRVLPVGVPYVNIHGHRVIAIGYGPRRVLKEGHGDTAAPACAHSSSHVTVAPLPLCPAANAQTKDSECSRPSQNAVVCHACTPGSSNHAPSAIPLVIPPADLRSGKVAASTGETGLPPLIYLDTAGGSTGTQRAERKLWSNGVVIRHRAVNPPAAAALRPPQPSNQELSTRRMVPRCSALVLAAASALATSQPYNAVVTPAVRSKGPGGSGYGASLFVCLPTPAFHGVSGLHPMESRGWQTDKQRTRSSSVQYKGSLPACSICKPSGVFTPWPSSLLLTATHLAPRHTGSRARPGGGARLPPGAQRSCTPPGR
jgi:hypothetical protein